MSLSVRRESQGNSNRSALLAGAASIFDFTGSLGPRRKMKVDHQGAASDALARSWQVVGDALQSAMTQHELPRSAE